MNAYAQAVSTLPPVSQTSGTDWPLLLGILAVLVVVGLIVWIKHRNPAAATAAATVVSADAKHLADVVSTELGKIRTEVVAKLTPAPAAAPAAEPVAATPAGKSGQAGMFTATVTGDPAVDLPALMAQYSAK